MSEAGDRPGAEMPPQRKSRGWLLTMSLMVNTLLIGLFIGQAMSGRPAGSDATGPVTPPLGAEARIAQGMLSAIDPSQRDEVRRAFREAIRAARPMLADRRRAQMALREAIVAEPFDAERLKEAFADLQASEAAVSQSLQSALAEQFGALSAEERQAIAKVLQRGRRGEGMRRLRDWREQRDELR